jgi:hypothetical protein
LLLIASMGIHIHSMHVSTVPAFPGEVQKKVRALEQQADAASISREQLLQAAIDSFPGSDPAQPAPAESAEERRERLLVSVAVQVTSQVHAAGMSLRASMVQVL